MRFWCAKPVQRYKLKLIPIWHAEPVQHMHDKDPGVAMRCVAALPKGSAKASVPDRPMPGGWVGHHFALANPPVQVTQGRRPLPQLSSLP